MDSKTLIFDRPGVRRAGMVMFLVLLAAIFWFGRESIDVSSDAAAGLIQSADPWLAWPVTVLLFVAASFLGVPQWALIGGAVIAFGPATGATLSWVSTMVSSSANFLAGRAIGGERLRRRVGPRVGAWMDRLARHGILASMAVRVLPLAPFFVVNMAGGASTLRYRDFAIGTAIGIVPKIAVIALFGQGLSEIVIADNLVLGVLLLAAALLVIAGLWMWKRRRSGSGPGEVTR